MALSERLRKQLELHKIPYEILQHREVFTSQEVAQTARVPGRLLAKPIVIREAEDSYYMVVVEAPQHVDLAAIHHNTGRPKGRLATEPEIARLFPDCELGAMPPVGHLYGLPTYIDEEFRRHEDVYLQAGNHREVVKMKFADFEKVAGPFTGEFALHQENKEALG